VSDVFDAARRAADQGFSVGIVEALLVAAYLGSATEAVEYLHRYDVRAEGLMASQLNMAVLAPSSITSAINRYNVCHASR